MERHKTETQEQFDQRLIAAAKTLTQDQINACAWVMGGSGCGWNKEEVVRALAENVAPKIKNVYVQP